jgi:cytoskeletal protein CcmA (bactofilin family)
MSGNVVVDNVVARSGSIIKGNITCKSLTVEQYVTIIGRANIHSLAPEYIDHNGDIIIDAPEVEVTFIYLYIFYFVIHLLIFF